MKKGIAETAATPGGGVLPRVTLRAADGARAEIYLYGGQVTSWAPAGEQERLYLSRKSLFQTGAPIRGGIPVVFPQFGATGPLPVHGLARLMTWELGGVSEPGDWVSAVLRLRDTEESRAIWPHPFAADLTVSVGGKRMEVRLEATNTGREPFSFTGGLHTYFRVADLHKASVRGLRGMRFRDAAKGWVDTLEESPLVEFADEVNRVYFEAPGELELVEPGGRTVIRQAGFTDTVIWNPGAAKCALVKDMEPEDYLRFVCVEAATYERAVRLNPGERWEGVQSFEV